MLPGEVTGIKDLLSRLEDEVVYSLADTATKRALAFPSVNGIFLNDVTNVNDAPSVRITIYVCYRMVLDAVNAILLHCESANWLLNRKKMTRAILFEYLNSKRIPISGQAEKSTIVSRILELWGTEAPQESPVVVMSAISVNHNQDTPSPVPEMGLKFTQWFYEILLAVHKQSAPVSKLAEQFWKDVRLKITFNSPGVTNDQEVLGSDEVGLLRCFICILLIIQTREEFN